MCSKFQLDYLGSAIGTDDFVRSFLLSQVQTWCDELILLTDIARSKPHAPFSSYILRFESKWMFSCSTTPSISHLFATLDTLINASFLPTLTPANNIL